MLQRQHNDLTPLDVAVRNVSSVAALVAELGAQTPALHPPNAPPGGVDRGPEGPSRLPSGIPQGDPPLLPSGLPHGDLLNPLWEEGDEEGAGSSSEDTSDAFYQALHREFETQEQIKFGLQNAGTLGEAVRYSISGCSHA